MAEDTEQTEKLKYKGEAEATDSEKKEVGGEKTLELENKLFQSDDDCQDMADALLSRLKTKKNYFDVPIDFCQVPVERRDLIRVQEFVTSNLSIWHYGLIRQVKLSITPTEQRLVLALEKKE